MIIHMLDKNVLDEGKARYVCIHAVYPSPEKSTLDWSKVTCKNCLKKHPLRRVEENIVLAARTGRMNFAREAIVLLRDYEGR